MCIRDSLGLLVVRSSVRRWPYTRVVERRRQNKVEDSIMLFKADNLHRQDRNAVINVWRNRSRAGEQGLHIINICIIKESFFHLNPILKSDSDSSSSKECLSALLSLDIYHLNYKWEASQCRNTSKSIERSTSFKIYFWTGNKALSCRIMPSSSYHHVTSIQGVGIVQVCILCL